MPILSKRSSTADEVRRVAMAALAAAISEVQKDDSSKERSKPRFSGTKALVVGAALYTAGRAAIANRDLIREQLSPNDDGGDEEYDEDEEFEEDEEEPEAEEEEDFEDEEPEEPEAEEEEDFEDEEPEEPEAEEEEDLEDEEPEEPEAEEEEDFEDEQPEEPEAEEDEEYEGDDEEEEAPRRRPPRRSRAPVART